MRKIKILKILVDNYGENKFDGFGSKRDCGAALESN